MAQTPPSPATSVLTFTGERFAPEIKGAIWYEHWHRYCVVQPLARGLRALDAACGEGYGSFLLAREAREVIGVDIAAESVAHATARYGAPNLRYVRASAATLPLPDASIDLVISFETIEHLTDQAEMLAEFRRVLVPSGVLIISSPNKTIYSEETGYANEYHVRELTRDELAAMLAPEFPQQAWYGQRVLANSLLWSEQDAGPRTVELMALAGDAVSALAAPAPPMYYIVVCGSPAATLPGLPGLSMFDDGAQSLYRDYQRALLSEKRLYWDVVDARKIAEQRLTELVAAVNDLARAREHQQSPASGSAPLQAENLRLRSALAATEQRLAFRETLGGWLRWPLARLRQLLGRSRSSP